MHRIHGGLTVIAPIKGNSVELGKLLKSLNGNAPNSAFQISETTLFAAGVILPAQTYQSTNDLPESLVFDTTYCGPLSNHLDDLMATNFNNLRAMFTCCDQSLTNANKAELIAYIHNHSQTGSFSSGYNLITKNEVKLEKDLRKEIGIYLDKAQKLGAFDCLRPTEIKTLIYRHVKSLGDEYNWAFKPFRKSIMEWWQTARLFLVPAAFILLLFFLLSKKILLTIILTVGIVVFFRYILFPLIQLHINRHNTYKGCWRPEDKKVRAIAATQLNPIINGMTAAAPLKDGLVRRYFYYYTLKIIGLIAHIKVKVPTVSSIRWLSIDNKKRLLFLSNYSNTTDFYVRDFLIGKTPIGVNFMFSNGKHFPDAKFSYKGGIRDQPENYMNAVHTGQHVMDLWYTHDNSLTVDMINRNRTIRKGLIKKMNDDEAREWLRLL